MKGILIIEPEGGSFMSYPTSIEQFVKQASQLKGETKIVYVNQSDYTPEEAIITDEDTTGRGNMQLLRVLASVGTDATYYEEPFYDTGELEQVNVELEELKTFTRKVISLKEMEEMKTRFGMEQDSIEDEKDPM